MILENNNKYRTVVTPNDGDSLEFNIIVKGIVGYEFLQTQLYPGASGTTYVNILRNNIISFRAVSDIGVAEFRNADSIGVSDLGDNALQSYFLRRNIYLCHLLNDAFEDPIESELDANNGIIANPEIYDGRILFLWDSILDTNPITGTRAIGRNTSFYITLETNADSNTSVELRDLIGTAIRDYPLLGNQIISLSVDSTTSTSSVDVERQRQNYLIQVENQLSRASSVVDRLVELRPIFDSQLTAANISSLQAELSRVTQLLASISNR